MFYQLKGVPEDEAKALAARLIAQPESVLRVFIPIIPFSSLSTLWKVLRNLLRYAGVTRTIDIPQN